MPAGLLRLRKPSVVIRKKEEGSSATDSLDGCNGCNGCQEEGRWKMEDGRWKSATGNVWDLTDRKKQGKRR
jgi:hypothetical protein